MQHYSLFNICNELRQMRIRHSLFLLFSVCVLGKLPKKINHRYDVVCFYVIVAMALLQEDSGVEGNGKKI